MRVEALARIALPSRSLHRGGAQAEASAPTCRRREISQLRVRSRHPPPTPVVIRVVPVRAPSRHRLSTGLGVVPSRRRLPAASPSVSAVSRRTSSVRSGGEERGVAGDTAGSDADVGASAAGTAMGKQSSARDCAMDDAETTATNTSAPTSAAAATTTTAATTSSSGAKQEKLSGKERYVVHTLAGYKIEGVSVGGQETCIVLPQLKMAFDSGRRGEFHQCVRSLFIFVFFTHD